VKSLKGQKSGSQGKSSSSQKFKKWRLQRMDSGFSLNDRNPANIFKDNNKNGQDLRQPIVLNLKKNIF